MYAEARFSCIFKSPLGHCLRSGTFVCHLINNTPVIFYQVQIGRLADQSLLAMKFGSVFWHHDCADWKVWAGESSWMEIISFHELNSFCLTGLPVVFVLKSRALLCFPVFHWHNILMLRSVQVVKSEVLSGHNLSCLPTPSTWNFSLPGRQGELRFLEIPNNIICWIRVLEEVFGTFVREQEILPIFCW